MRNRTSATTYILVALGIGVLFMVGKLVTPPPATPPEPPKEETPPAAAATTKPDAAGKAADGGKKLPNQDDLSKMDAKQRIEMYRKMSAKYGAQQKKKKFDPNSVDVTADYWNNNQMGEAGTNQLIEKVERAKAEQKKNGVAAKAPIPKAIEPPSVN